MRNDFGAAFEDNGDKETGGEAGSGVGSGRDKGGGSGIVGRRSTVSIGSDLIIVVGS